MNQKLIDNLEFVHSRLKWLSKDRKIVLPHHKTFDLVDENQNPIFVPPSSQWVHILPNEGEISIDN